jgi:hypothetical protein
MAPRASIPLLVAGMLVTGIGNSIFSKWQDMQCVEHCAPGDEARRVDFSQPVWQVSAAVVCRPDEGQVRRQ